MSTTNNQPQYIAHSVKDREDGKAIFTRIGAAFDIQEGKGLAIKLDALPVGDRIILFAPKPEEPPTMVPTRVEEK